MTKKKVSKKAKKLISGPPYHLVMYVEDGNPKIRKFDSPEKLGTFVKEFQKEYPDYMEMGSDNWIDYVVMDIMGDVFFFTDGITIE